MTTTTPRKNGPNDVLGWNWMKQHYNHDHETYMEQLPSVDSVKDLEEWNIIVGSYSIECCRQGDEEGREVALHTLSSITGLTILDIAHHAMREARSIDLAYEYSVGLG